jgi:hypothetical protein
MSEPATLTDQEYEVDLQKAEHAFGLAHCDWRAVTLAGYEGELRQLTVMELGHEEPTVLLTNHRKLGPVELVTRYAQRMLIENGISEAVQFFHIDALSSMVGMKVDFDMQLTLMASSLYRMMAHRIGREYRHS